MNIEEANISELSKRKQAIISQFIGREVISKAITEDLIERDNENNSEDIVTKTLKELELKKGVEPGEDDKWMTLKGKRISLTKENIDLKKGELANISDIEILKNFKDISISEEEADKYGAELVKRKLIDLKTGEIEKALKNNLEKKG